MRAGVSGHEDTLRRNRLTAVGCRPPPGLDALSIVSERLVAAVPANRPRAQLSRVTLADISAHPMVCMPTGTGIRTVFDQARAAKGLRPTVALQASAPAAVADLAVRGLGVAILCESTTARYDGTLTGLVIEDVDIPAVLALIWRTTTSPPVCKLLRHCRHARDHGAAQAHASSPRGGRRRPRSIARRRRHHVRRRPSGTPGDASRGRTTAHGRSRRIAPTSRNNRAKTPKDRHLRRGGWRPLWQRSPRLRRSQQWRWRESKPLVMVRTGRVRGLTCGDCAVVAPGQVPSGSVVDPVEDASALVWARFTPSIRSSSAEHQTRVAPPQASRQVGDFRREPRDRDGGRGTAAPLPRRRAGSRGPIARRAGVVPGLSPRRAGPRGPSTPAPLRSRRPARNSPSRSPSGAPWRWVCGVSPCRCH